MTRTLGTAPLAALLLGAVVGAASCNGRCTRREAVVPDPVIESFVTITSLGGSTPVQGEGTLRGGAHFYFRARHEAWQFQVGASTDEAIDAPTWRWEEPFGDRVFEAGYMPEETARAIIESCGEMFAKSVAPPTAFAGMPDDELQARKLASSLLDDVVTYHGEEAAEAGVAGVRAALAGPIEEARAAYRKRVDPRFFPFFEEALDGIEARARDSAATHARWLLDAPSARSVGKRWAAMLRRMPRGERDALADRGARWFSAWTAEGEPRDTVLAVVRTGDAGKAR
jgi:hypothetical protein